MTKKKLLAAACASLCLAGGLAFAGAKYTYGIYVGASQVNGTMGDARASGDANSYLYVYVNGTSSYINGYVFARDYAGNAKYCYTTNPQVVSILSSAPSDAYLFANFDAGGQCTSVGFENGSPLTPKTP